MNYVPYILFVYRHLVSVKNVDIRQIIRDYLSQVVVVMNLNKLGRLIRNFMSICIHYHLAHKFQRLLLIDRITSWELTTATAIDLL